MLKKIRPCKSESALEQYAFFLLSKKDYSYAKMREKLVSRLDENSTFDETKVLQKLLDNKYIDDKRLAKRIVEIYGKKEQGFKLEMRMKKAMIAKDDYIEFLQESKDEFSIEDSVKLLFKKFKVYEFEKKDKYIRFLMSKHIDYDLAKKSIEVFKNDDN